MTVVFSRVWAMPNAKTFTIPPVREFVDRWMEGRRVSVDPFAGDFDAALYRNDLDPAATGAQRHVDAREFLDGLCASGMQADIVLFDPPYTPRQIAEVYKRIGLKVQATDTQSARFKRECRDRIQDLTVPGSVVLSFGYNTTGMGITRGWTLKEVLLVPGGGDHNDLICIAEVKGAPRA